MTPFNQLRSVWRDIFDEFDRRTEIIVLDCRRADAVIALHDAKQRTAKINSNLAKQVFGQ